ncbi:unnamed protein product [Protopolystoma xenopodis]|uniref:Uncharacterized protein n=1 Tax=Protopolystoma xenopodis TaxID=117903 RepID=A0A448X3W0_9PLAT|nr:unnamed protein product [Protopolystoma xenopodis]
MATRSNLYFSPEIDLSAMTEEVNRYSGSVKRDYGGPSRQGILRGRPSNRSAEIVQRLQANDNEIKRSGTSRNQEKESCF